MGSDRMQNVHIKMCELCECSENLCLGAHRVMRAFDEEIIAGNEAILPWLRSLVHLQGEYHSFAGIKEAMAAPTFQKASGSSLMLKLADLNGDESIDEREARSLLQCIFF